MMLSIVIPVYNEAGALPTLCRRLTQVMEGVGESYEVIFINDGSSDASSVFLRELRAKDARVKLVSFSRNFGHQIAITAGLDYCSGQAVIVMDGDLQHPPELIPRMIEKWREGYDVVYAVKESRGEEGFFKRKTAALFYRLFGRLSTTAIPMHAADFRLMSRRAAEVLKTIRERNRFVRGLAGWIGFRQTSVTFVADSRYAGKSKYSIGRMVRFALDGITSFSVVPLQLATYMGFSVSCLSLVYSVYAVGLRLFTNRSVPGWASVIVAVLFLGGVQLITLGIIGEYIGRIYEEVKQRPLYIIDEVAGFEDKR